VKARSPASPKPRKPKAKAKAKTPRAKRERTADTKRERTADTKRERTADTKRERSPDTKRERSPDTKRERSPDTKRERFDAAYYDRFYRQRGTRVSDERETAKLGRFVCSYVDYLGLPVRHVLDAGCGLGRWRGVIAEHYPRARYTGIEVSEYLCDELGWTRASIAAYRPRARYDLVICQGVLQYLDDREADAALDNLGQLCRGVLYLEALTAEDWRDACDQRATDGAVHRRPAAFYRERLAKRFVALGGGLFVHEDAGIVLYALERA
jgi:SAM-dependent methyltransferase